MTRLLPGSLAGRMTLVLVAGLVLVVVAGVAVGTITVGGGQASLVDRVVTLVAVGEATPAAARPAVYAGVERAGLSVRELSGTDASPALSPDGFTDRVRGAWPASCHVWALVCWPLATWRTPAHRGGPILVSMELSDGARLQVIVARAVVSPRARGAAHAGPARRRHGLTGLALYVARAVTRPLGRFAKRPPGSEPTWPPRSRSTRRGRARSVRSPVRSTSCRSRSVDCWMATRTCWRPSHMICVPLSHA